MHYILINNYYTISGPPFTSTTPAEPQSATAATSEAGSGAQITDSNLGFTSEQLGNLRNILSGIQVPGTYIEIKG